MLRIAPCGKGIRRGFFHYIHAWLRETGCDSKIFYDAMQLTILVGVSLFSPCRGECDLVGEPVRNDVHYERERDCDIDNAGIIEIPPGEVPYRHYHDQKRGHEKPCPPDILSLLCVE